MTDWYPLEAFRFLRRNRGGVDGEEQEERWGWGKRLEGEEGKKTVVNQQINKQINKQTNSALYINICAKDKGLCSQPIVQISQYTIIIDKLAIFIR